jgi:putative ABC transport system permease protein
LASVIIGEVIFGVKTLFRRLSAVIFGAILYRLIIAVALELGMPPTDLKLVSAVIVAIALSMNVVRECPTASAVKERRAGFTGGRRRPRADRRLWLQVHSHSVL